MHNKLGIELDYVSGSFYGYLRIGNANKDLELENINDAKDLLDYTKSKLKGYFNFSTLFNAYQEEKGGQTLANNDGLGHKKIYSDSGGLQVLTAGKVIDDTIRDKVYEVQAKYSDYAMTFDEMPLMIADELGDNAVNGNVGQVYIDELIPISAKKCAEHIQKQINKFEELKSNTKILPILHGYTPETFLEYAENIFNNLENVGDHIQGIAIASLRGHSDNKVGIMKLFDYLPKIINSSRLNKQYLNHIHLLGVARPQRIIPIIMMLKKGLLPVKRVSFDSTAITKSYTIGKVYPNLEEYKNDEKAKKFSPVLTLNSYTDKSHPNIEQFYINIHNLFKDYKNYMFEDWEDLAKHSQNNGDKLTPSKQFEKYGIEYERKYLQQIRLANMYHMHCYLSMIEAFIDDELTLKDLFGKNDSIYNIFNTFDSVNTLEEFADQADFFYTSASRGRTNLRILACKTIAEFEKKYKTKQPCLHEELGIEKDVVIINEELKKPWIKSSMKRAKKNIWSDDEHPGNTLF